MSIKFIQLPPALLTAILNDSDTSFDVAGFLLNDGITPVDPTDIGDICYATLEPRTERAELISFTIDSVTAAGVATLTAVRGLSQISPYGTGGATAVAGYYNAIKKEFTDWKNIQADPNWKIYSKF